MQLVFQASHWDEHFSDSHRQDAVTQLEQGRILCFPKLAFSLLPEETFLLSPDYADPRAKNIGYHPIHGKLWGAQRLTDKQRLQLAAMLHRFSRATCAFVQRLLSPYNERLIIARTSFRPVQISHRKTSYRKDDRRLHVDAFPSAPNQGKRILRVFCNINPHNQSRIWRVGEPFEKVAHRFLPHIRKPLPGIAKILQLLKITKSYRTLYDHYMLQLHNRMKADDQYQKEVPQQELYFPSGSTWIVQTDHVSHAAMQGQYVLEQTFYLPVEAMQNESYAPLRVLEKILKRRLI